MTFVDNTYDLSVLDNTGDVTIYTNGLAVTVDERLNNNVIINADASWTFNIAPAGGTFAMLNISKWKTFKGVYVSHVAGQLANPTPVAGDYYAVDTNND